MPEPVGLGTSAELGWRLPKCWSGKKSWARPLELDAGRKTRKTGLASLKPPGLFFCFFGFFFKVILYYYFFILFSFF